jgi:DNA polymerase-3 subunit epsilon
LFAVVDLETTGLVPQTERIVEMAVVRMDAAGTIHSEWTTLVQPEDGRGAGKTSIHGIESEWLRVAPTFAEIAGDLFAQISGCLAG